MIMENEKELLEKLVAESKSYAEILRKLGKSNSGAATRLLKQKLDDLEIKHHFILKTSGKINKIPLNEILKQDRPYKSSDLKRRLIEEGLKENKCEECGISEWRDHPLSLQLHHINGDHNDNRLENLQILCPNCHSITDNFGSKKLKKENYCLDCGIPIGKKSTYCRHCGPKHTNQSNAKVAKEDRPSKEELLELIKTKSFCEIGRMYGVSDNSIRKWCRSEGLPSTKTEIKQYLLSDNK